MSGHRPAGEPCAREVHPERLRVLIARWISRLGLDLQDRIVVTEAGTNHFALTALIAAQAGADRVLTLSSDSRWGKAARAHAAVEDLRRALGAPDRITPLKRFDEDVAARGNLFTNLGWVRPLDASRIAHMRPGAVIAAMCEAWEVREGDIDLSACARQGVRVAAVNEDHPLVDVFQHNGLLAVKMLQQLQIEIHGTRICVAGRGKFADRIAPFLEDLGAAVSRAHTLSGEDAARALDRADALVVADYDRTDLILGEGGEMTAADLIKCAPHVAVIQFAGWIRPEELLAAGLRVFPEEEVGARRMGRTMAYLGPAPLVGLHAAGMKAAAMLQGDDGPEGLVQEILTGGPGAPGD
ncbi:MAG: hypothetical protein ACE5FC_01065 [Myxococcota bacterium]